MAKTTYEIEEIVRINNKQVNMKTLTKEEFETYCYNTTNRVVAELLEKFETAS